MRNTPMTEAYKLYYENVIKNEHPYPEFIARWGADPGSFETQVMCRKAGTKVPDSNKFECDGEIFGPSRWPYEAGGEANYNDPPIQYIIKDRMKLIGWTGWNWKKKQSHALGFDFDSITGHAEGVGISDDKIARLDALDVDFLEVIRSKSGSGRHIYIFFKEPYPITETHTHHAALARAFIPLITENTGIDIQASVDVCGGNMWIWDTNTNTVKENQGFTSVHPATQILTADFVPPNWEDNLEVVSGGRAKVRVQGWTSDGTATKGDELDEMTQAHAQVELDETHLKILDELEGTGHSALWVHDHHLWQGHTGGLKQIFDDWAEREMPMRGLFDTNSLDQDPGKPNCFMRPKPNGAWDVYRFGEGTDECPLWDQQGKWTHTTFNFPATLKQICFACGGYEGTKEEQGFMFETIEQLKEALRLLGSKMDLPDKAAGRELSLHSNLKGKVVLVIEKKRGDEKADFPRYVKTTKGWEKWLFDAIETSDQEVKEESLWSELDDKLRALKVAGTKTDIFDSWMMMDAAAAWTTHPRENIRSYLASIGFSKPDEVLGGAVFKAWKLTSDPFQVEYPGGRMWNRDGAQLVYGPAEMKEGQMPYHPTWTRVMEHCGVDLNEYLPNLLWCKDWGITTGGDYLTAWVACMFQNPYGKLPYLFMYGPQNSGKSSFHESLSLLITKNGVAKADRALTSEPGYNGELAGAVLAIIDEADIAKAGASVYNKIKEWVTGLTISMHAKYKGVIDIINTLHFVQTSNSRKSLPLLPGDTRITAMNVPCLEEEIPRERLQELLRKEGPHFMRTLMDLEIPEATGRLMLPVIETQGKRDAADDNVDELEQFIRDHCYEIPGTAIKFEDFRKKFLASLEVFQQSEWKSQTIRASLSEKFMIGTSARANQVVIGNLSFDPKEKPGIPYTKNGGRLLKEKL